jgi:hypothetical protein
LIILILKFLRIKSNADNVVRRHYCYQFITFYRIWSRYDTSPKIEILSSLESFMILCLYYSLKRYLASYQKKKISCFCFFWQIILLLKYSFWLINIYLLFFWLKLIYFLKSYFLIFFWTQMNKIYLFYIYKIFLSFFIKNKSFLLTE